MYHGGRQSRWWRKLFACLRIGTMAYVEGMKDEPA